MESHPALARRYRLGRHHLLATGELNSEGVSLKGALHLLFGGRVIKSPPQRKGGDSDGGSGFHRLRTDAGGALLDAGEERHMAKSVVGESAFRNDRESYTAYFSIAGRPQLLRGRRRRHVVWQPHALEPQLRSSEIHHRPA
jgi:hypothetical protein